MYSEIINCVYD